MSPNVTTPQGLGAQHRQCPQMSPHPGAGGGWGGQPWWLPKPAQGFEGLGTASSPTERNEGCDTNPQSDTSTALGNSSDLEPPARSDISTELPQNQNSPCSHPPKTSSELSILHTSSKHTPHPEAAKIPKKNPGDRGRMVQPEHDRVNPNPAQPLHGWGCSQPRLPHPDAAPGSRIGPWGRQCPLSRWQQPSPARRLFCAGAAPAAPADAGLSRSGLCHRGGTALPQKPAFSCTQTTKPLNKTQILGSKYLAAASRNFFSGSCDFGG